MNQSEVLRRIQRCKFWTNLHDNWNEIRT